MEGQSSSVAQGEGAPTSANAKTRAVVTGAAGMVGRRLVEELEANGYDVVAIRRDRADLRDLVATERALAEVRPDIVFHLAARVAGLGGNLAAPGEMFYENLTINSNVIEAARRAGTRKLVAVGSAAIYSDVVALPMSEDELWLGPPHHSEAPYGHAKRAMLAHLEAYRAQYGLDFAYVILTNSFGPDDTFDEQYGHVLPSLISKFHRAATTGGRVTVWGTGTAQRDFLYSKDVARALRIIAEQGDGPINVASGTEISIRDLVDLVRSAARFEGAVDWDASKPNGQELRRYDISRLQSLGFEPKWPLPEAIAETYAWFADNPAAIRR